MRLAKIVIATALALSLTVAAHAAPGGPKAPKVTKTTGASQAPKASGPSKAPKPAKATTVATKPTKPATQDAHATKHSTVTASTPTAPTGPIDFTAGKVGERLTRNTALRSKLETQLKALGYEGTVYQAAYGFKNQGQLVAAINNAQNQNISFEQLKTLMTGLSVDSTGTVLKANLNPDGTVTMVPIEGATNPAPTQSLGQAKKTIATTTGTDTVTATASN